jgi:hypothetical protein
MKNVEFRMNCHPGLPKYCAVKENEYLEAIHFSLAGCKQSTINNRQSPIARAVWETLDNYE